jgi:hypothetical protein
MISGRRLAGLKRIILIGPTNFMFILILSWVIVGIPVLFLVSALIYGLIKETQEAAIVLFVVVGITFFFLFIWAVGNVIGYYFPNPPGHGM